MTFRKLLFWMHLTTGVVAGLVILLMSVTGVLLAYEKQLVAMTDRTSVGTAATPPSPGSARLGVEALLTNIRNKTGILPNNVTLRAEAAEPVVLALGDRGTVYANAYTGNILEPQSTGVRNFFRSVTDWHRYLGTANGGDGRIRARAVTGASNLAFLFMVTSGLYLWMPRVWKWPVVRRVLWFRGGLPASQRDFNWHNVTGFWCCVPLFFVVISGVMMSYPWANNLVYRAAGVEPPAQGKGKGKQAKGFAGRQNEVKLTGLDALVAKAQTKMPEWQSIAFQIPATEQTPVSFNLDAGNGGQPQKRATLALDRATGEVRNWESWQTQDAGRRARNWLRFVHTGEFYGIAGQTVAGAASAGAVLLLWTGIALAYRRMKNMRATRARATSEHEELEVSRGA